MADTLKLNKLSIYINKIMVGPIPHASKQVNIPNIEIANVKIEFADKFIFYG